MFRKQGLFDVNVQAFDKRHFCEESIAVTVFKMPCSAPIAYLPINQTSFERWDRIPEYKRSASFQYSGFAQVECNVTTQTWMEWRIFSVNLIRDELSQIGLKEELSQIQINSTIQSYTQLLINIPPRILQPGLHKLVFHFEVS